MRFALRVLATLAAAWLAALLCVHWQTPIPWMIGPLLATAALSVGGSATASWAPLRNAGQWVIGTALGLYFTPQVGALVASLWWAVALGVAWALALGAAFGWCLARFNRSLAPGLGEAQWRSTTYFASAIGGASEMTLLAERHGARTDLVAAAHSLRVLIVTLAIPFAVQSWAGHGDFPAPAGQAASVQGAGLLGLAALTGLGAWLMRRWGRANPWFMGALLVSMGLTLSGQAWTALPTGLTNAAQLAIGVSLGVRFTPAFLRTAPRWLAVVAVSTVVLMVLCAALAWGLSQATSLPLTTLVLGTAPGGIAEMSITAKVLQWGVPVVTAFQVSRLVAVLVLAEPIYRRWVAPRAGG